VTTLDRAVLAERTMVVQRHLQRVAGRLPPSADDFQPATDASDAVILHLWQATQIVVDQALRACRPICWRFCRRWQTRPRTDRFPR
jgi:hypothetical protein